MPQRIALPVLCAILLSMLPRVAAGDDKPGTRDDLIVAAEATPAAEVEMEQMRANFDQWVFPGANNAEAGRQRLQTQTALRLAEIERVCQPNASQKQKLQLAARGDLQRFLDQVEQLRQKFNALKNDQNALGQLWQELQPLQARQANGLIGPDSLLVKIVPKMLTPEQAANYQAVLDERLRYRYQSSVAISVAMLEGQVALRHQQREALTKLLLSETRPPRVFGQYDHYLIMYRLAALPPEKIQPLLDDRQWQLLRQQFNQYRGMRAMLIQQGVISREELGAGEDAALAPQADAAIDLGAL